MGEPSRARLLACAKKHQPRGWKLSPTGIHPDLGDGVKAIAYADFTNAIIVHPEIVDRDALYIFLHECGHVHHKHGKDCDHTLLEQEWEAEQYAMRAMRADGIPIRRSLIRGVKRYLRNIIEGLYAERGAYDESYAKADVAPSDEIMRFVYGPRWRTAPEDPAP